MIRFGYSGMPDTDDDGAFLDGLIERGYDAFELAFVKEFPWNLKRCATFGEAAAARGIALSIHAPYFAVLTVEDEDRSKQCLAAVEHTMKLAAAAGADIVCVHPGSRNDRPAEQLVDLVTRRLEALTPKVEHLGVGLGLETTGKTSGFGTLGDIAIFANRIPFVRPLVDWAHLHAISRGALTSVDAFVEVFRFLEANFPGWMIDPLHCQFSEIQFGDQGEIRHLPYGDGTLRIGNLVAAARLMDLDLTIISEAREQTSTETMYAELRQALSEPLNRPGRPVASGLVDFPEPLRVVPSGDGWKPADTTRPLVLRNIDKPFFPDGYTKGDLIQYYASVAGSLLPHLADRPIVMSRYPDGIEGETFYEKQAPPHTPDWLPTLPVFSKERDGDIDFVTAPDRDALLWLASMGCIEMHPWLSRRDSLEHPDYAIFDLDPADEATWEQVVVVAGLIRETLGHLGLTGYPKTSGATGIHIYVPLDPVHDYRRVRRFVEAVGRLLFAADPDDVTMEWDIPKRTGKVFIDHNQNVAGKTIASVYSVRPRPGAPVSTPFRWDDLPDVHPGDFTIATVWDHLRLYGDLFAPVLRGGQRLDGAEERLGLE